MIRTVPAPGSLASPIDAGADDVAETERIPLRIEELGRQLPVLLRVLAALGLLLAVVAAA